MGINFRSAMRFILLSVAVVALVVVPYVGASRYGQANLAACPSRGKVNSSNPPLPVGLGPRKNSTNQVRGVQDDYGWVSFFAGPDDSAPYVILLGSGSSFNKFTCTGRVMTITCLNINGADLDTGSPPYVALTASNDESFSKDMTGYLNSITTPYQLTGVASDTQWTLTLENNDSTDTAAL